MTEASVLWTPSPERVAAAHVTGFAAFARAGQGFSGDPANLHRWSIENPEAFWEAMWGWARIPYEGSLAPVRVWDGRFEPGHLPSWFPNARLNVAEALLYPAPRGPGGDEMPSPDPDTPALICRDESGGRDVVSWAALRHDVARFAEALEAAGVQPGDRVAAFLPNRAETVVAFLGCAWVGAIWSSCSPDFGASAVVDRFGQIGPRVFVTALRVRYKGKTLELQDRVEEILRGLSTVEVVVGVDGGSDRGDAPLPPKLAGRPVVAWDRWIGGGAGVERGVEERSEVGAKVSNPSPERTPLRRFPFDHPLAILYSSGTTGLPKCIVHTAGGTLLQHRKEHQLHVDLRRDDRFFYFTTCGWMMWNWLVSGLAEGATLVLYDGAPVTAHDPGLLWRIAAEEGVHRFGTSARYLALMEKEGVEPGRDFDLSALQTILSTGSPLAPASFDWVYAHVKSDVHLASISGGTDIVSCFVGGLPTHPVRRGEIQGPGLGMGVEVRAAEGEDAPLGARVVGRPGELVCTAPFPSLPLGFWGDPGHARYRAAYFARALEHPAPHHALWCHGDWAEETVWGGFVILGRSDATLNPGGVRIGTAELYRQVEAFDEILEAIAVGVTRAAVGVTRAADGVTRSADGVTRSAGSEDGGADGSGDVEIALFVKLAPGHSLTPKLEGALRQRIRTHASPHHVPKSIEAVPDLPRTVSGKLSEIAVREQLHGRPVKNLDALANPESLVHFARGTRGAAEVAATAPEVVAHPRALTALLQGSVDYAGLFPPASLSMEAAVANYAAYRAGPERWALGRFVVPAARLDAFEAAVAPYLRSGDGPEATDASPPLAHDPWPLSVLVTLDDAPRIEALVDSSGGLLAVPSIEAPAPTPEAVAELAAQFPRMERWLEVPLDRDPRPLLEAIHKTGSFAKVRTGGVTAEGFPDPDALFGFLSSAVALGVRFKATAGLHHALRGHYPLTYAPDAPRGLMYGYLNLFLATAALRAGRPDLARTLLVLDDPSSLHFRDDAVVWGGEQLPRADLESLRAHGLSSFGSCSLQEPVDELAPFA